mgnify:FL=1
MSSPLSINQKVLVLNRGYVAIGVVSARQAFSLLCRETAEIISSQNGRYETFGLRDWIDVARLQKEFEPNVHQWIRLPSLEIAIPKIVRLLMYDKFIKPKVRLSRQNIYSRDKNMCQYCGKRFATKDLTIDHVVPRVQGGINSWSNLVCACLSCNTKKGGRTPKQASMALVQKPVKPKQCDSLKLRIGKAQYHSWKNFLNDTYWSIELED